MNTDVYVIAVDMITSTRPPALEPAPEKIAVLETIEAQLRWLSSWTIHNANHLRDSRDGLIDAVAHLLIDTRLLA